MSLLEQTQADRINELEAQLALSRSASQANWRAFTRAQKALSGIMLWADVSLTDEQMTALKMKQEYSDASKVLGWDIDWASVAERQQY